MQAIQGKVPGLMVTQASGKPGDGYSIQLRGINSLRASANNPMFVIDGIPFTSGTLSNSSVTGLALNSLSPLNGISPADIESIEVLKDADATAIYGSRGANGVILITTKSSTADRQKFTFDAYYGVGKPTRLMRLLNTSEYVEMRKEAFVNDGIEPDLINAPDLLIWDTVRYTDWQKKLVGNPSSMSNVSLNLNGSSGSLAYNMSVSRFEQGTVFPGDFGYRRISGALGCFSRTSG